MYDCFEVIVNQKRERNYFDENGKKVEYTTDEDLCGVFENWEDVVTFSNLVMSNFKNATVSINIKGRTEE